MIVDSKKLRHIIYEYGENIGFNFSECIYFGQTPLDLNSKGVGMCFSVVKGYNITYFQKYCNKNARARIKKIEEILKIHNIPFTKTLEKRKIKENRQYYYITYYFIPLNAFGIDKVQE